MRRIGPFDICGLLGRGGMAKVYTVKLPVIGKIAALKLLAPHPHLASLLGGDRLRELFIREAVTMANLRHPHIVDIALFDESARQLYYIMEYIPTNIGVLIGETYRTEAPSRIVPVEKAIACARQVLSGLARLHYAGIVHRDIKPFNLLITEQETVKICDFGLSKLRGESFAGPPNLKVGSPFYAAPEQERLPDAVDATADLYAVGVLLYRMLTGRLPEPTALPASRLNPLLDDRWDRFLTTATAARPAARFRRAADMIAALDDLTAHWTAAKANICRLPSRRTALSATRPDRLRTLRTRPVKVSAKTARRHFGLDRLWRPRTYATDRFRALSEEIVADPATGRLWQRSGSPYPMTWRQAADYVGRLNERQFAGYRLWRLPTVDELVSLITAPSQDENLCIEPVFDIRQRWLWSCDRRSYIAAWYVSVDLGFVAWHDFSGFFYVRAVCSR
jgi:serine/threonine-protein kinase